MKHEKVDFRPPVSGNYFKRALAARTIASLRRCHARDVAVEYWPNDRSLYELITRAASAPAMTTTTGWAAELVNKLVIDTLDSLGATSSAADVMKEALVVSWDGYGTISAPGFVASANSASFVAEGNPIPVRQLSGPPATLNPYKLATIAALTREMVEGSNAENLISDALVRSCGLALDAVFFGNAASSAAQPAGIRNGISTSSASANADPFAAFFEDVSTLVGAVSAVGGKGPYILVGSPGRVASLSQRAVQDGNIIPIMSTAVGNDLIAIAPQGLVAALSPDPDVETANAATLVMDTVPGAAGTTGTGEKEMFQSDSIAIKVRWPVSWALRDSRAVAWLTPAWK